MVEVEGKLCDFYFFIIRTNLIQKYFFFDPRGK